MAPPDCHRGWQGAPYFQYGIRGSVGCACLFVSFFCFRPLSPLTGPLTATLAGKVEIWDYTSVMNEAVIRGDVRLVRIGAYTTIGEGTVVTEAPGPLSDVHDGSCIVGHYVSVGPNCTLHAATIEPECVIGAGSVLAEGSYMATQSRLEPGSYLAPNARVPTGELWGGKPEAIKIRSLSEEERAEHKTRAEKSFEASKKHKEEVEVTPYPMDAVWEAENLGFGNIIGYQLKQ